MKQRKLQTSLPSREGGGGGGNVTPGVYAYEYAGCVMQSAYLWAVAGLLLTSGLGHIFAPELTERWMSRIRVVQAVGGLLLLLALPCLVWRGWYFWTYRTEEKGGWNFRAGVERGWFPAHFAPPAEKA